MTLADIYERELAWVLATLRRLGVAEADIDDAAHEVFVVVHRKLAEYDRARPLRPWLFGVAYRVARDHLRSTRRRQLRPVHQPAPAVDPEAALSARGDLLRVADALQSMSYERRAAFVMYELDGFSVPEISAVLGRAANTLYSDLHRARQQLREALADVTRPEEEHHEQR